MKRLILLSSILLSLAACRKEAKISPKIAPLPPIATATTAKPDTIPDLAVLKIKLCHDSLNYEETVFMFNHASSLKYLSNYDTWYFMGFGLVSLASISSDGIDLASRELPYTSGMSIGLDVRAKTSGTYYIKISYEDKIPANVWIWVKDTYLKDSVDVRTSNYKFSVSKANTNSFGSKRFRLILKDGGQQ